MNTESIYEIDWQKYKNCTYSKCCSIESNFLKTYHTCPSLLERKKKLEKLARAYKGSKALKNHFQIEYRKRKEDFYQKIIYEILSPENDETHEICDLTKDILFIYSKKREEKDYLDYFSNHLEAEYSHREEERESMIEDWRNCD